MEPDRAPDCVADALSLCAPEHWRKCDRCHRLVCEKHDCLYEVWHQRTSDCGDYDMLCQTCVETAYAQGEISQGEHWEYILKK
jgi:hypothetical protein